MEPGEVFEDKKVEHEEIVGILDVDGNDRFEMPDLARLQQRAGWDSFSTAKTVLNKHGFNLYDQTQDDLSQFARQALDPNSDQYEHYQQNYGQILQDPDLFLSVIRDDPYSVNLLENAPSEIKEDSFLFSQLVEIKGGALEYAADDILSNREIVLAAVKNDGMALRFASDDLRNDRRVVGRAVANSPHAFEYASDELRGLKPLAMLAVSHDAGSLEHASDDLRDDQDVVMRAVQSGGYALRHASENMKDNEQVVTASLNNYGSLEYASERLRSDKDFVLEHARLDTDFQFFSEALRADPEIVEQALSESGDNLQFVGSDIQDDKELVLTALSDAPPDEPMRFRRYGHNLQYASERLRNDRDVVMAAVESNPSALEYASEELRSDRDIVRTAVLQYPQTLDYADPSFKSDKEFLTDVFTHSSYSSSSFETVLEHIDPSLLGDEEFMRTMIDLDSDCLEYASDELKGNREIVLSAAMQDSRALEYADDALRSDLLFLTEILENTENRTSFIPWYASNEISPHLSYAMRKLESPETREVNPETHPELMLDLVMEDFNLIRYIPEDKIEEVWPQIQQRLADENVSFAEEDISSRDAFFGRVDSFTKFPERFHSFGNLSEVTYRQVPDTADPRPVALLLYPGTDWNGAFASFPLSDTFVDSDKFQVIYKEVSRQEELEQTISSVGDMRQIHTLVIAGHGMNDRLQLGDIENVDTTDGVSPEELVEVDSRYIFEHEFWTYESTVDDSTQTVPMGDFSTTLNQNVAPGGQVLLYSCSNGSGGEQSPNMTNAFASVLPQEVQLYSTLIPSNISDLEINDDLTLSVQWLDNHSYQRQGEIE